MVLVLMMIFVMISVVFVMVVAIARPDVHHASRQRHPHRLATSARFTAEVTTAATGAAGGSH